MIFVGDLPRMASFYEEILGFRVIVETRTEQWVEFETGGAKMALHASEGSADGLREQTPIKLLFTVKDMAAECGRLKALGVQTIERPWGGVDFADPEGNIFGLLAAVA